ncbi:hypothetical protein GCM10010421_40320 [Streptomyces glaucus]|uniref:Uncharacterized protein n=1 Tax=Streptomyces glaucus TaxID=284029 RepID=A0ABP5X529_9ACTN
MRVAGPGLPARPRLQQPEALQRLAALPGQGQGRGRRCRTRGARESSAGTTAKFGTALAAGVPGAVEQGLDVDGRRVGIAGALGAPGVQPGVLLRDDPGEGGQQIPAPVPVLARRCEQSRAGPPVPLTRGERGVRRLRGGRAVPRGIQLLARQQTVRGDVHPGRSIAVDPSRVAVSHRTRARTGRPMAMAVYWRRGAWRYGVPESVYTGGMRHAKSYSKMPGPRRKAGRPTCSQVSK